MAKAKGKQSATMGRPSKYKPEFCSALVEHMAKGLSFESFAAVAKVDRDTIYEWTKAHQDFSDAYKRGHVENMLFYERMGVAIMAGKVHKANVTAWIFNMKNRHKWRDLHAPDEASGAKEHEKTIEEALAALDAEKPKKPSV